MWRRRLQLLLRLLLVALLVCHGRTVTPQDDRAAGAQAAVAPLVTAAGQPDRPHAWANRHLAAASSSSSSSSSGSGNGSSKNSSGSGNGGGKSSSGSSGSASGSSSKGSSAKTRCTPTIYSVAKRRPELRQALQLAAAGYNFFSVDGASASKRVTVLAPSNSALQALAADVQRQRPVDGANSPDAAESAEKNIAALKAGFYSVVLYSQLPGGAYNISFLRSTESKADEGLQTSLGKALSNDDYTVSFNRDGKQTTANGGWPANNAPILSWHEACDGFLYVVTATLRPKQQYTSLPKLQGKASVSTDDFMRMLDGSYATAPDNDTAADAPAPAPGPDAGSPLAGNHSASQTENIVVSNTDGSGTVTQEQVKLPASFSPSSGSSDSSTLVVAASCAGAAVALCITAVVVVTLRKRRLRRQRAAAARPGQAAQEDEDEDELDDDSSIRVGKAAGRPVQLRVDA